MTNHKQVVYKSGLDHKSKMVLRRRTRRRFNPKIFIDRTIETTAIASLFLTGFLGIGAMACWGLEIIETNNSNIIISVWQQQKSICLGVMLVSFSAFLGISLIGASFSIQRDKF
ncbi:MAG: hypothetical protein HWQ35_03270 [Nostoc sp. NMS1]|uniref:hypothetical protein n=1 Tax=unclassified Nostoc TaxID=2593658 RepID=UPI0025D5ACDF|nr:MULTISPECIES: hypothetical protein [unclassified Nostoc]MBN3905619.1 hypothetical protein [Nostoc sp. NMS1]MBN3989888.1 hypothetical protein [Nostoc sp. NMS2]